MTRASRTAAGRPVNKIAIVCVNERGLAVARRLRRDYPARAGIPARERRRLEMEIIAFPAIAGIRELFREYHGLVMIMATGIAVRVIAPCLADKRTDPAVVAVDTSARYAIALVSGHEGGANLLAVRVANTLDAEPVITTGTEAAKRFVVGIGSRRGVSEKAVLTAIRRALSARHISPDDVRCFATVELKAREAGIIGAALTLGIPLRIFPLARIREFRGEYTKSPRVERLAGVGAVAEPVCQLGCRQPELILSRQVFDGVTVAIAEDMAGASRV